MLGAGRGLPCQHEGQSRLSAQGMLAASAWSRMAFTCRPAQEQRDTPVGGAGQVCLQDSRPGPELGKLLSSPIPLRQPAVLRGRAPGQRGVGEASPGQRGSLLTPPLGLSHNSLPHQKRPCTGLLWSWPAGHFLSWFLGHGKSPPT